MKFKPKLIFRTYDIIKAKINWNQRFWTQWKSKFSDILWTRHSIEHMLSSFLHTLNTLFKSLISQFLINNLFIIRTLLALNSTTKSKINCLEYIVPNLILRFLQLKCKSFEWCDSSNKTLFPLLLFQTSGQNWILVINVNIWATFGQFLLLN